MKKNTGHKREQVALQRLIEISLRTGDYTDVDDHLARLSRIPAGQVEPSVPYVRGKYLFFRDRLDDALAVFNSIPAGNDYFLQSRYFIGTIQVRKGDYRHRRPFLRRGDQAAAEDRGPQGGPGSGSPGHRPPAVRPRST